MLSVPTRTMGNVSGAAPSATTRSVIESEDWSLTWTVAVGVCRVLGAVGTAGARTARTTASVPAASPPTRVTVRNVRRLGALPGGHATYRPTGMTYSSQPTTSMSTGWDWMPSIPVSRDACT